MCKINTFSGCLKRLRVKTQIRRSIWWSIRRSIRSSWQVHDCCTRQKHGKICQFDKLAGRCNPAVNLAVNHLAVNPAVHPAVNPRRSSGQVDESKIYDAFFSFFGGQLQSGGQSGKLTSPKIYDAFFFIFRWLAYSIWMLSKKINLTAYSSGKDNPSSGIKTVGRLSSRLRCADPHTLSMIFFFKKKVDMVQYIPTNELTSLKKIYTFPTRFILTAGICTRWYSVRAGTAYGSTFCFCVCPV